MLLLLDTIRYITVSFSFSSCWAQGLMLMLHVFQSPPTSHPLLVYKVMYCSMSISTTPISVVYATNLSLLM
jgi:hypothetical protein